MPARNADKRILLQVTGIFIKAIDKTGCGAIIFHYLIKLTKLSTIIIEVQEIFFILKFHHASKFKSLKYTQRKTPATYK